MFFLPLLTPNPLCTDCSLFYLLDWPPSIQCLMDPVQIFLRFEIDHKIPCSRILCYHQYLWHSGIVLLVSTRTLFVIFGTQSRRLSASTLRSACRNRV